MPPKKKKVIVANSTNTISNAVEVSDDVSYASDHVLLKLPLTDSQLDTILQDTGLGNMLQYNPSIYEPEPYVPVNPFGINPEEAPTNLATSYKDDNAPETASIESVVNENNFKKQKKCFWCCYDVGHMTHGMPIRYDFTTKTFTMYGTFCSLECAAAHNFSVHLGSDRAWEIHSWIQMLGKRFGYSEPIRPAPSRYLLELFDGPLTINDFRNAHKGQTRTYVLNIPPIINVSSQMEIVNTSFLGSTTESIGHIPEKMQKKPRTLDAKMNLTIEST